MQNLGVFDGTEDLEIFLMKFEAVAEVAEWTESDRLSYLIAVLEGKAAEVLLCQKYHSPDDLIDKLRQWFVDPIYPEIARDELRKVKQDPGETLQALAARVERLDS